MASQPAYEEAQPQQPIGPATGSPTGYVSILVNNEEDAIEQVARIIHLTPITRISD